jgi:hypothetical protein
MNKSLKIAFSIAVAATPFLLAAQVKACTIGSTDVVQAPEITVTAPARQPRWKRFWGQGTYVAPPGWAITRFDYSLDGKPSHLSWNWLGNGGQYSSYLQIQEAYQRAMNAAASYGRQDVSASLQQQMNQMLSIANGVGGSQGAIDVKTGINAAGIFRNSRTVRVFPRVTLLCVGTPQQVEAQIQEQLNRLQSNFTPEEPQQSIAAVVPTSGDSSFMPAPIIADTNNPSEILETEGELEDTSIETAENYPDTALSLALSTPEP